MQTVARNAAAERIQFRHHCAHRTTYGCGIKLLDESGEGHGLTFTRKFKKFSHALGHRLRAQRVLCQHVILRANIR